MKPIHLFLPLFLWALLPDLSAQNVYDSLQTGNRWRTYMTHLPADYNPQTRYPLVLCFHGGQNGAQASSRGWQAVAFMSKLNAKADSAGFVVVYPEGTVINNNRTWNAGGCCQPATTSGIDDAGFVSALLDRLHQTYSIDTARVYASGSSNGAMLCYRLACEMPGKFAAIATISGTQEFFPCNPARQIPVISFHSRADAAVPYTGGTGEGPSGTFFTSQDSTLQLWTQLNGCTTRDTVLNGGSAGLSFIRIKNCDCQTEIHHYATSDGGHSWPGGNPNNNPVSFQVNATRVMWDFFQSYTLGCETTGIKPSAESGKPRLLPNPATASVTVTGLSEGRPFSVSPIGGQPVLQGLTGQPLSLKGLPGGCWMLRIQGHPVPLRLIKL